ncbi:putative fimbrial-like adhesin protein [Leminorella richardii]|uniref:Putative fimbrial-like adhesin protein n=1 Tax=Leminorella richardii TaxID=158841 RepID=A0A2X4UX79_9GAMM|nr:fimbrial protein [Leminorella richardii]SQI43463.1 putative fimbrial-like adhesin protein [Leminorella richardii]
MKQTCRLLLLLVGLLPLAIGLPQVQAEDDNAQGHGKCYVEGSSRNHTVVVNPITLNIPLAHVDTPVEIFRTETAYDFPLTDIDVGCKASDPYFDSRTVYFINSAASNILNTQYSGAKGQALLKTTVPGINYTVELICDYCDRDRKTVVGLHLLAGSNSKNTYPSPDDWFAWENSDAMWKLRFRLYQTPEFKPQTGVSEGRAISGKIATWRIGGSGEPEIYFVADTSSLHFTVTEPTCDAHVLISNGKEISNNTLSLGEYYTSQVKNSTTPEIPFTIRGKGCSASKIKVKMVAANSSPKSNLLGKTNGSASGAGVKVVSKLGSANTVMMPNGTNWVINNYQDDWWALSRDFYFTAQLLPDGQPIAAGNFSAKATFTFNYE